MPNRDVVSVEAGYELWARTYDADPNPLLAAEERALKPLLRGIAGKVVLDAACGTGRWLEKLLNAGARSGTGIDASAAMLRVAQSKPALRRRLVMGDCLAMPFPSRFADLVICSFALAHITELERFARELARVGKVGGDVWVSDLHPEARAQGWTTAFRYGGGTAEITAYLHSPQRVRDSFQVHQFLSSECQEIRLSEPERPIFERAGKRHFFERACKVPAVCIWHFTLAG
ncbi:MAG: class I SAM-dependent methyltransferase [Terriglobia bacterium]